MADLSYTPSGPGSRQRQVKVRVSSPAKRVRTARYGAAGEGRTMAVYFSFYYRRDALRVQQVLNMGQLAGQKILTAQAWETVKAKGDAAVERWIDDEMRYKEAVVVLIGKETASRRWVKYEITKAWNEKKPLVGIRIHGLKDPQQGADTSGPDPFAAVKLPGGGSLAQYVPVHDPGPDAYKVIEKNLKTWIAGAYRRS